MLDVGLHHSLRVSYLCLYLSTFPIPLARGRTWCEKHSPSGSTYTNSVAQEFSSSQQVSASSLKA